MSYSIVTAPVGDVVTVPELRDSLRYLSTDSDNEIANMQVAAVELVESDIRRQLLTATWELKLDRFEDVIRIEKAPVTSVTKIEYIDTNGATQTLASSDYQVDLDSEPARIKRAYNTSWPSVRTVQNAVTITFVSGYGANEDVPESIKHAIKLAVGGMFEDKLDQYKKTIDDLLMRFRYDLL